MTREEAINVLKEHIDTYVVCHGEEDTVAVSLDNVDVEALDMAIKAIQFVNTLADTERRYENYEIDASKRTVETAKAYKEVGI